MRYLVHHTKDFDGTHFVEIGPGKYSGKHWQKGFLFVDDEDFTAAEGLIRKHLSKYDHYAMNDVTTDTAFDVIAEWRKAAKELVFRKRAAFEILSLQFVSDSYKKDLENERLNVSNMLIELADSCEKFVHGKSCFCILGV